MKAVVEEVMGLRRGEGDEREGRFLAECENGEAGVKGGHFSWLCPRLRQIFICYL